MNVAFPYQYDARGRTADPPDDRHVREMIEQLLFTSPGERVNRPTWGSGVLNLLFAGNSPELAAAAQLTVNGALQQWLGDLIHIEGVKVASNDSQLSITVQYIIRRSQERHTAEFTKSAL
jgi:phage baseplate assembly protein W